MEDVNQRPIEIWSFTTKTGAGCYVAWPNGLKTLSFVHNYEYYFGKNTNNTSLFALYKKMMDASSTIKEKHATFLVGGSHSSSPQGASALKILNKDFSPDTIGINTSSWKKYARELSVTFIAEPGLEKYTDIKCKFAGDAYEKSFAEHLEKFGINITSTNTIKIKKTINESMDDGRVRRALNVILETNDDRKEPTWHIGIILSQMAEGDLGEMFDQYGLERQGCAICPQNHDKGREWTNDENCDFMVTMIHEFLHTLNLRHNMGSLSTMGYPDKYYWGVKQYWKDFNCNLTVYEHLHICHAQESHIIPGGKGFDDPDVEVHSFAKEGTGLGYVREKKDGIHRHNLHLGSRVTLLAKENARLTIQKQALHDDQEDLKQTNALLVQRMSELNLKNKRLEQMIQSLREEYDIYY